MNRVERTAVAVLAAITTTFASAGATHAGVASRPQQTREALLRHAATWAEVLSNGRLSPTEPGLGADLHGMAVPPSPSYSSLSDSPARLSVNLSFDGMYRSGAKVADVYGPADDGYRTLSMKIYTFKLNDGALQSMLGIVDITPGDPATPYAPKFVPVTQSESTDFALKSGGRRYTLSVSMDQSQHDVLLTRQRFRPGEGGALSTSVEELARLRADQAATGDLVTIGARQFYTLIQGGVHGSVLFFPREYIDARADIRDTLYLRPVAMGDVLKLDGDGLTVPMDGHPDIGMIDGVAYHLEYDGAAWSVVAGPGDRL